jgi:hypothetical protein
LGFLPLAFEGLHAPQGSGAGFGPPWVFYFPSTYHIWWTFPYLPPGEALDGRPATPHEAGKMGTVNWYKIQKIILTGLVIFL